MHVNETIESFLSRYMFVIYLPNKWSTCKPTSCHVRTGSSHMHVFAFMGSRWNVDDPQGHIVRALQTTGTHSTGFSLTHCAA